MKLYNLIAITLFVFFNSNAQNTNRELPIDTGSIDNKFEYIIKKSSNYENYKVVRRNWLNKLRQQTSDSLNTLKSELKNTKATIEEQKNNIENLNTKLNSTQTELNNTLSQQEHITFLGLQMSKSLYSTIVWVIVGVLLLLLGLFIYKFKNSNAVTKIVKSKLDELEEEHENYRRTSLEREQKVRRQLQDEINKNNKNKSK